MQPTRLLITCLIPVLATLLGYAFTSAPTDRGLADQLAAWPEISTPVDYSNSAERIINDIGSMYLFGRSMEMIAAEADVEAALEASAEDERGLSGITLIAIAGLDDKPTAMIDDVDGQISSVTVGDELGQAWKIQEIGRDNLTAEKDGEYRTLYLPSVIAEN